MSVRNLTVSVAALLVLVSSLVPQETAAQNSTNPYRDRPKGGQSSPCEG